MRAKTIQAKHLSDEVILRAIPKIMEARGHTLGASRWDIGAACYPDAPERVVLAKLRSLVRRGLLTGCDCGCRGDFNFPVYGPHEAPRRESTPHVAQGRFDAIGKPIFTGSGR